MSKIDIALQSANETKALIIERGASAKTAALFKEQFPNKTALIVADTNTYTLLGEQISKQFESENIKCVPAFIFDNPDLYAEYSFVEQLEQSLKQHEAIVVAVGSGTINDLCKLASHLCKRPYMCVATAASMDGYTAFGASITANGAKQTFNCPAPQACIADIDIISKAPAAMTASGYADLFAKITAGADWILADALGVEAIDQTAWDIVQGGLHEALSDPEGTKKGDYKAISQLVEGLMLGGFAMQWSKSSRPASGAEHQFSHLWNMEHHLHNGEHISHGFQVSIGTLAVTSLYEVLLKTDLSQLNIESCVEKWPKAEQLKAESLELFADTDFPEIGAQETAAKYINPTDLRQQLQLLVEKWPNIQERLSKQLVPFAEAKKRLDLVGAPTDPEQIGISRSRLRATFIRAQYIRRRFTILDVALRTGLLEQWLDELFGQGGVWEIKPEA